MTSKITFKIRLISFLIQIYIYILLIKDNYLMTVEMFFNFYRKKFLYAKNKTKN